MLKILGKHFTFATSSHPDTYHSCTFALKLSSHISLQKPQPPSQISLLKTQPPSVPSPSNLRLQGPRHQRPAPASAGAAHHRQNQVLFCLFRLDFSFSFCFSSSLTLLWVFCSIWCVVWFCFWVFQQNGFCARFWVVSNPSLGFLRLDLVCRMVLFRFGFCALVLLLGFWFLIFSFFFFLMIICNVLLKKKEAHRG